MVPSAMADVVLLLASPLTGMEILRIRTYYLIFSSVERSEEGERRNCLRYALAVRLSVYVTDLVAPDEKAGGGGAEMFSGSDITTRLLFLKFIFNSKQ